MIDEEILIQCFFKSPGECIIHCTGSKDTLYALHKVHIIIIISQIIFKVW